MPDWTKFRETIGATLESVQAYGRTGIRAYAEMVDILWREGRAQAAIRVEEYWNEIATIYPLSLFCGYMLDHHDHSTYRSPLREIGRTHTEVLSTDEDERFGAALDAASRDVFGVPLNNMLRLSHLENYPGEERLPGAQRTMLWMMRHLPSTSGEVLRKAKKYLAAR
jgi:hypothetical protein